MKLKAQPYDIEVGRYEVILNSVDAEEIGILAGDRVQVKNKDTITAVVETTDAIVSQGRIGIYREAWEAMKLVPDEIVDVLPATRPKSVSFIRKKMDKLKLTQEELFAIIEDITEGNLTDVEMTAFVTASYIHSMDGDEIEWMTRAMVKTGDQISFDTPGHGPPQHRRRARQQDHAGRSAHRGRGRAAHTEDELSRDHRRRRQCRPHGNPVPVSFRADEIKKITTKVGGCIVWGGATNIAPADDKIIGVEYPLSIDPHAQLLASVMAKKFAVGADTMVLDIPWATRPRSPPCRKAARWPGLHGAGRPAGHEGGVLSPTAARRSAVPSAAAWRCARR